MNSCFLTSTRSPPFLHRSLSPPGQSSLTQISPHLSPRHIHVNTRLPAIENSFLVPTFPNGAVNAGSLVTSFCHREHRGRRGRHFIRTAAKKKKTRNCAGTGNVSLPFKLRSYLLERGARSTPGGPWLNGAAVTGNLRHRRCCWRRHVPLTLHHTDRCWRGT